MRTRSPTADAGAAPATFALEATRALQKTAQSLRLAKQVRDPDPFLTTLAPLLSDVEWPSAVKVVPNKPFNRSSYTQLDRLVRGSQQAATTNIRKLAKSTNPRAPAEREKFQTSFKRFANTQKRPRGPPLSDLIILNPKPTENDGHPDCLEALYTTLSRCSLPMDGCGGVFRANLALTRVERLKEEKDGVPFNLFFVHRHPQVVGDRWRWKEVRIRVFLQGCSSKPSKVQWLGSNKISSTDKISPMEFCKLIRHEVHGCLILKAADDGLVYERLYLEFERLKRLFLLKASSVSLATVLEKRKLDGHDQLKILLSYLLAKALWQSYDSDWMTKDWTKHTIHFMRECINGSPEPQEIVTLIHKPFFAAEFRPVPTQGNPVQEVDSSSEKDFTEKFPSMSHSYPKILALGIMLLEIELGKGIEQHLSDESPGEDEQQIDNYDHYNAGRIILSPMWERRNTYQAVKEMIEICLKPDIGKLGTDQACIRNNLYTYVVAPLGRLFRQAWSRDKDPETFSPDPVSFNSTELPSDDSELLNSEATTSNGLETPSFVHVPSSDSILIPELTATAESRPNQGGAAINWELSSLEDGELLEEDDPNTPKSRQVLPSPMRFEIGRISSSERLKVAILDSGINLNHPDFNAEDRERIKKKVTFIGGNPEVDETGHGTHIAAIILKLTKNVDLYIGKITDSKTAIQREKVKEALFEVRMNWGGVHMISLSFGFDSVHYPDNMGAEIHKCLNDGIIVFASASNDGAAEGARTYPAKYQRVICVYSASWLGKVPDKSPGTEGHENFCTVGEDVRPKWPSKDPEDAAGLQYKSGSSYATPVALSIAAFMIGYIRKRWPDHPWVAEPCSPEGIATIFELMSKKIDGYDWISPTRYLKYNKAMKVQGDIMQKFG
ncbi:uncharacterized protein PAC_08148 [Phialocephala subalpina]|uniref:Uncharacterized protein n=1 Tax=Phialocephala subalpina TaxID=576137 RepID=A0A1L7WZS6_9HELO|nr:uncharacterized protein PAC_08148 [Phialocephala subalpina]